jgi:hypothetical protein
MKVSRTVLKTSGSRERVAQSNSATTPTACKYWFCRLNGNQFPSNFGGLSTNKTTG